MYLFEFVFFFLVLRYNNFVSIKTKAILRNGLATILVVIFSASLLAFSVLLCFNLTHIKTTVYSTSMQPTLNINIKSADEPGDTVYVNKYKKLKVGDIVVAKVSWWESALVKRLVGLPGDNVLIKQNDQNYELIVNGEVLYTRPVSSAEGNNTTKKYNEFRDFLTRNPENVIYDQRGNKCLHLLENQYLLMGDNWNDSFDSLSNALTGPAKRKNIYGNVDIIFKKGHTKFDLLKKVFCLIKY